MSVQIAFLIAKVERQNMIINEQPHNFELRISNKQFKESLRTNLHAVQNGWVNLPQNIFVLPLGSNLQIEIQQRGSYKTTFSNGTTHGQYQFNLEQIQKRDFGISESIISFQTDNKQFKVDLTYKYAFIKNKIFAGYFNGCLLNQGSRALGLIDMKLEKKHYQSSSQRQYQKYAIGTLTTQQQSANKKASQNSIKKTEKSWRHWIHICNQAKVDEDLSYFQDQSTKGINQKHKKEASKSKTEFKNIQQNDFGAQISQTSIKQKITVNQIENKKNRNNKQQKLSSDVNFYKGSCKNRNIFSCIDSHVDNSQVYIIQPKYR